MSMMAPPKKRAPRGRPRNPEPKHSLASLKGSEEYREWLEGFVDHARLPMAILIEHALYDYARKLGYSKPQPKR